MTPPSQCQYLDSISLSNLDFDFEKRCSISLSPVHVYACLTCGKYFAGRGPRTRAYEHALERGHHVYMHLDQGTTWCLPDGYRICPEESNATLKRIKDVLRPRYDEERVSELETGGPQWRRALDGTDFLVGVTGLNNIWQSNGRDDGMNAVVQALARVGPLRRALLLREEDELNARRGHRQTSLFSALANLMKKMWNAKNFKGHSSQHEFLQAVRKQSKEMFGGVKASKTAATRPDAMQFLRWMLNELIREEKKDIAKNASLSGDISSVVEACFQGEVEIVPEGDPDLAASSAPRKTSKFLMLSMDLPAAPLFQDVMEKKIIPQVSLERQLLKKFDGTKFRITKLPEYLIVTYSRFTKNNFFVEKNPTIVTFPTRGLNIADHVPIDDDVKGSTTYDLIANIVHDGTPDEGSYRSMVYHASGDCAGDWYETQDLRVSEVLPQQVSLTETYVQIYQRRDGK